MPIFEPEDFKDLRNKKKMARLKEEAAKKRNRKEEREASEEGDFLASLSADFMVHCSSCGYIMVNEDNCGNCGQASGID